MPLSDSSKILILVVLFALVLYLLFRNGQNDPIRNEGMLTHDSKHDLDVKVHNVSDTDTDFIPEDLESKKSSDSDKSDLSNEPNESKFYKKMTSRNSVKEGDFKQSNYNNGRRQSKSSSIDKFFEGNHPNDKEAGSGFSASIENEGKYAAYLSEKGNKKLSDKDKFNPASLMPKEKNGEWFDDPYETTNVKSSHLINVYRPIGVNTIQTTLKNPSHDIRGTPANPKYAVSPWGNSSYEPDTNLRNQSLCY